MVIRYSNVLLDQMVTGLSMFTAPLIPALALEENSIIVNNSLAGTLGVFSGLRNAPIRSLLAVYARHVFGAVDAYRLGRQHAYAYVEGDRKADILPYLRALNFFETAVSHSWLALEHCRRWPENLKRGGRLRFYEPNDNSAWERLHDVYTKGSKHSYDYGAIAQNNSVPKATPIWLTNNGIECKAGAVVTYGELADVIFYANDLWCYIQDEVLKKHRSTRSGDVQ